MSSIYGTLMDQDQQQSETTNPEQSKASVYGALMDRQDQAQRAAMGIVLDRVMGKPADHAARSQELSQSTRLPLDVVERNFDALHRRDQIQRLQDAMVWSPVLREQMTNPEFAALAHDDVFELNALEKVLRVGGNIGRATASGLPRFNEGAWGLVRAGAEVIGLEGIAGFAGAHASGQRAMAERWMPQAGNAFEAGVYSGFQSFGLNMLNLPLAFIPGGQGAAAARMGPLLWGMGLNTGGQAYGEARDQGMAVAPALAFGASQGVIEAGTEMIGMPALFSLLKPGKLGAKAVEYLFKDQLGEQAATVLQDLNEWAVLPENTEKSFAHYLRERPNAALQTAIATAVGGGAQVATMKGIGMVVNRLEYQQYRAHQAEQGAQLLEVLTTFATASKLATRAPDSFEQFIAQTAEEGPVSHVFISADALMQSGVADQITAVSPSVAAQAATAEATGGQIAIPVEEFAARIAPTEYAQGLLDHLKTDPEGFSRAEAQEWTQERQAEMQAEFEKAAAQQESDDAFRASADTVRAQVKAQLDQANRFTSEANEVQATLAGSWYAIKAAEFGITPEEQFQRYPLQVVAQGVADSQVLDQGRPDPVASLTGEEIAPRDANIKTLRARAKDWYAGNLNGKTVINQGSGREVHFQNANKAFHTSANPVKLRLFAALSDIVANGTIERSTPPVDQSKEPSTKAYHWLTAWVDIDGTPQKVGVTIRENQAGDLYYNHNPIPDGNEKGLQAGDRAAPAHKAGGVSPDEALEQKAVAPLTRSDPAHKAGAGENEGTALGQSLPSDVDGVNLYVFDQPARGTFSPSTLTISLLKGADLSTFAHELGHFFLEAQFDMASHPDAPDSVKQDAAILLEEFGVRDLPEWYGLDLEQQRPFHEQFARSFEAFLFEGKAPSIEMQGVFQRFRAWMISVYRELTALNVQLSDEVRGVFDRMLASGEQIAIAEQARSMMPLFETAEQAGMTAEEFAVYQSLGINATADAIQDLQTRGLRDMQWLHNARARVLKQLQKDAEAQRAEMRIEARREVMSQPVYQAWQFLTTKEGTTDTPVGKLSPSALDEMYGGPADGKRDRYALLDWKRLTDLRMTAEDGLPPDTVAEMNGFASGDEMVRAILAAEHPNEAIEGLTDSLMIEQHGDLATPEALARAADQAIHNDARARFTATEANALARATGQRRILAPAAREFARAVVARTKVRDLRPSQHTSTATRAGANAERAMKAGDLARAAAEKRNQVVQQQQARETMAARDEVERTVRYLTKFDREGTRKNLDLEYLEQIDTLLERFDLRAGQTLKAIDKRTSLASWIDARSDEGTEPDIAPWLVAEANRTHYKNLTVEELRGLADAVKQIEHLGRLKQKLLTARDKRALDAIVEELQGSITENAHGRVVDNERRNTLSSRSRHLMRGFMAAHRKFANLVREMDGFKDGGPLWGKVIRPMNDAGNKETTMRADASRRLNALVQPVLAESGLDTLSRMGGKGTEFKSIGRSLNHGERLVIALNLGNEGNQQRLLDGRGWTIEQLKPVLDTLTARDWQMVQGVWDFFESFRPEIAALERNVRGTEPDWVEPVPLTVRTADGQTLSLRGGYYPVKYDRNLSGKAGEQQDRQDAKDLMRAASTAAITRRSYTKQRAEEVHGQPIDLSFSGIYQGANEVIHDLAWREWLIDVNRLVKRLDSTMRTGYGAETVTAIRAAIKDIAQGDKPATNAVESTLNHLRTGATVAGLGWNLKTALLQPLGVTQSMARVGTVWMARGIREFYGDPLHMAAKVREVNEQSDFMANRARTMNREINEVLNQLSGVKGKYQTMLEGSFFVLIQKAQMTVDYPTWLAAYAKAEADPANALKNGDLDTHRVVALADQAVIDAQGEGQIKDLAQVQRGHPALKLFTNFYSYFSTSLNLAVDATKRTDFRDPRQVAALAGDYLLIGIIPAVMSTLLNVMWSGSDDDDSLIERLISEQIDYLLGMFVGLREVSGASKGMLGLPNPFGYSGPAGLRFFAEMNRLGQQIGQGELDSALAKAANNTAGILFHYPAGQVQRTVQGVSALVEGRTRNPLAPVTGYSGR